MTETDWNSVRNAVERYPNRAALLIDGYRVELLLQAIDPYRSEITVFVNGRIKTEWALGQTEEGREIRRRFYFPSQKCFVQKPKGKPGKKEQQIYREMKEKLTVTTYLPFWKSFSRLKAHLIRNNTHIEIMRGEET